MALPKSLNYKYKNQSADKLKTWVENASKKTNDKIKAGINVCEGIINLIKADKTMVYGPWALKPIRTLQANLRKGLDFLINNEILENKKNLINDIAKLIDNAENETLENLARNRTTQDSRDITNKGNGMFIMEGGNDVKKQTGNIIFTKAANPVRIDQALKGLFDNPDIVYEIDYAHCDTSTPKGKAIKDKMNKLIGIKHCYLCYDKDKKTYMIRDSEGKVISQRAYIREGVKLIPEGVRKREAYNEERTIKNTLGSVNENRWSPETNRLRKFLQRDMPTAYKDDKFTLSMKFDLISKTENRIAELLRKAKKFGYELHTECISKKWRGTGHMELHLIKGDSEVTRTVWENDKKLGEDLYDFIDDNEDEYKTYLTNRVLAKRQELDRLTKEEISSVGSKLNSNQSNKIKNLKMKKPEELTPEEKLQLEEAEKNEKHKIQVLRGISMLEDTIDAYRVSEGDNWLSNNDRCLVEIKQLIRNAKASINESDILDDKLITKNFIEPIREKWVYFKNLRDSYGNPMKGYNDQHQYLRDVFFGDENEQITGIRKLGGYGRLFDNTETSHLKGKIEEKEYGLGGLRTKNPEINKCINNIEARFNRSIYNNDGTINENVKKDYDFLLNESNNLSKDGIIGRLKNHDILPKNWEDEKDEVLEAVEKLQQKLRSINEQIKYFPENVDSLRKKQHQERLKLEQKRNKGENDLIELQSLMWLEEHPEAQNKILTATLEGMKNETKYGNLGKITKGCLMPALAFLGGGTNNSIYDDMIGIGAWNLSDENAKLAGEIATEIAITVAVAVVTAGIGEFIVGGALAGSAAVTGGAISIETAAGITGLAVRAPRYIKLAKNIEKIIKIRNTYKKATTLKESFDVIRTASNAERIGLLTTKATGLLIEGTAFNAASTMVHSAINGTSLDALNLNPFARENIQTAAFLGALSFGGKITQSMMKVGGRSKLSINLKEGLKAAHIQAPAKFTAGLVSEMGSMLVAEQAINIVFGHDIIDPLTGEVSTSHSPQVPTQQEWIQMVGMLLAFRAVKPKLRHEYAQKLDNGTLEICRSIKNNERLLRNTKTGKIENLQDLAKGKVSRTETPETGNRKKRIDNTTDKKVIDRAKQKLHEKFDEEIMSTNGITIDGITYKIKREQYMGANKEHNPRTLIYTETGGKKPLEITIRVDNNSQIPTGSNGDYIRRRLEGPRKKYIEKNLNSTLESARNELDGEFTRDIESRSRDLEGKRKNRETLEGRKKSLSDEIEGLKSRKAELEQQLLKIQKELTIQPKTVSLNDIYSIINKGNKITIGGEKCTFIGVKNGKIQFKSGKGIKEFSSFKELKDAKANFDFDIKQRQGNRGKIQQERFNELVEAEARTKNANEIIRNYEGLKRQKAQIEQDIRDGFFRENAEKLVGKHIWIDGVEYQCTGKNTNNERTTLDFKKTDGNEHFTISSFEQLKNKGQIRGFEVLKTEQPKFERENDALIQELLNGEPEYKNKKNQELQQINQQLERGKADYDNAKLATSPKKVPNPEYERIKNEIDGINSQLIEKGQQLSTIERDLGASDTDISKLEQEIAEITTERNNLSRTERGNDIIDNNGEIERGREEVKEEIEKPEEMERKLDELITRTNNGEYENVKLDWVTKKMFEGSVYFEGLSRLFKKNRSFPKKFIKKIWDNFVEMKNKCRETLSEAKKKLVEKWNNFLERKLAEEGDVVEIKEEERQEIESIDEDILNNLGIKDITKKEMDIIQNILKNSELHNIFKKYLETGFIVREGIDKNTTIEQINKEIENIEKTISTIEGSKSNLLKIKNILFYVKQNILGRNISNLSGYQKRILATERSRYQTAINDICKRYTKLSKISENIIITEECDLKIIEQSLKDINLLPESTLQKIKDNGITIFLGDKTVTNRGFKNNLRGVHPRGRSEGRTRDEVGGLASGKIAIAGRGMRNGKYYSSIESSTGSPSMILHELGHTFDHCTIGDLSRTQEFIEFHKKLYDKLSSYEQQGGPGGEAGCSEFLAESTAQFFKRGEKKFKKYYGEEYYEYIKKQLVG